MCLRRRLAALAVCLGMPLVASAQDTGIDAETPPGPVEFTLFGTFDLTTFAAFEPEHRVAPRGFLDLTATVDLERVVHWPGASLVAQYYAFGGRNGSRILGDYEGFSAIDADPFAHLGELSLDTSWLSDRVRTRVGRLDANSDFALPKSTALFQHSSAGLSGAIFPMPTYPNPEPGAVVEVQVTRAVSLTGGAYAGPDMNDLPDTLLSDGRLWMAQITAGHAAEQGRLVAGAFRHTGRFATVRGGESASAGWFVVGERVAGRITGGRELVASVQASVSTTYVAPVQKHVAVGLRLRKATQRRFKDAMGIRVSLAELAGAEQQAGVPDERVVELFHRFALTKWLALQPDLQLIRLPDGAASRNRIAFTLRSIVFYE